MPDRPDDPAHGSDAPVDAASPRAPVGAGAATRAPRPALDDIERAHLRDPADEGHTIHRYRPSTDLSGLVRRFWIPVWQYPAGHTAAQQVLQYPVCLIVVTNSYARFYGVVAGLSRTELQGQGWAVGVMLQPAAGMLVTGRPVTEMTDRFVDLAEVSGLPGARLTSQIRRVMSPGPDDPNRHAEAITELEGALRAYLPVDQEGVLINAVVDDVETNPGVRLVSELCDRHALTERTLQRLVRRRVGLSPKWLILRRRLHEAAGRLREPGADLAAISADLGYADQTHFTRDFRAVTGLTPGRFAARYRPPE